MLKSDPLVEARAAALTIAQTMQSRGNRLCTGRRLGSTSQSEPSNQILVATLIFPFEVIQKLAALTDHAQQPTPGVVILSVTREVLCKLADPRRQQSHLNFRRPRIGGAALVLSDNLGFLFRPQ
jgi:hypothetical protein